MYPRAADSTQDYLLRITRSVKVTGCLGAPDPKLAPELHRVVVLLLLRAARDGGTCVWVNVCACVHERACGEGLVALAVALAVAHLRDLE